MRLVSFSGGFGRVEGDTVVPMGGDVVDFLRSGRHEEGQPLPLGEVSLTAPVPRPGAIICVGLNYREHAAEAGQPLPTEPVLFAKFPSCVVGSGEPIVLPAVAPDEVDFEAELAVVIGRSAARVSRDEALRHVAGYTCANDVSARDLQLGAAQWTRGKAIDTFLPLGPWLVTADEIEDPGALGIRCALNGDVMQASSTSDMVFDVPTLVSVISQTLTLQPGDVIVTGTPPGVGFTREPPVYLRHGDEVTVSIDGIGDLTNPVVSESP
jgi:2,4-didehydro-3-deoxy-L-rhamnonate hydrolase